VLLGKAIDNQLHAAILADEGTQITEKVTAKGFVTAVNKDYQKMVVTSSWTEHGHTHNFKEWALRSVNPCTTSKIKITRKVLTSQLRRILINWSQ